jgi:hypothetical protein
MKTQSCKAKGRRLQQTIVKKILNKFTLLNQRDVQSRSMGAQGCDIMLSERAFKILGFSMECKNKEASKALLKDFSQAETNVGEGKPLLIISANRSDILAILKFDDFLELFRGENEPSKI